ncbi:MAG: hypothetical protein WCP57_01270 [Bacteroidota bacterium]
MRLCFYMYRIIFIEFMICFQSTIIAQTNAYIDDIQQINNELLISLHAPENSCDGIDIYRSNDSIGNFDKIGHLYYNCDLSLASNNYHFTDINPIPNSINYYKISWNEQEESAVKTAFFANYNLGGFSIYNEYNQSTLFFNTSAELTNPVFILYDISGRVLYEHNTVTDKKVSFDNSNLHHGFYYFVLVENPDRLLVQGKFYIP